MAMGLSTKGWPIFGLLARLSEVILLSGQVPFEKRGNRSIREGGKKV